MLKSLFQEQPGQQNTLTAIDINSNFNYKCKLITAFMLKHAIDQNNLNPFSSKTT